MKRGQYLLESAGHRLQVTTVGPVPPLDQWWHEAIVTVPELTKLKGEPAGDAWRCILEYHPDEFEICLEPEERRLVYRGRPHRQELGMLMTGLFERIYAESGAFTLHAAAVQSPCGEGWLLMGPSFAGKTSSLIALSRELPQARFISNERVLLASDGRILGGTTAMRLKATGELANGQSQLCDYREFFQHRVRESTVDHILLLKLHRGPGDPYTKRFSRKRTVLTLYAELGTVIHNLGLLLDGLKRPVPSFDTEELAQRRLDLAHRLADRSPIVHFAGNTDELVEYIRSAERRRGTGRG